MQTHEVKHLLRIRYAAPAWAMLFEVPGPGSGSRLDTSTAEKPPQPPAFNTLKPRSPKMPSLPETDPQVVEWINTSYRRLMGTEVFREKCFRLMGYAYVKQGKTLERALEAATAASIVTAVEMQEVEPELFVKLRDWLKNVLIPWLNNEKRLKFYLTVARSARQDGGHPLPLCVMIAIGGMVAKAAGIDLEAELRNRRPSHHWN